MSDVTYVTPEEPEGYFIDGRNPDEYTHLCIVDLNVHDGPVEECCVERWRDEGAQP